MKKLKYALMAIGFWLLIYGGLFGFIIFLIINAKTYEYSDVKNYDTYISELIDNGDAHSGFFIFPNNIKNENIADFKYIYTEGIFDGTYFFYLNTHYDEEQYLSEINRLANISINFASEEKKILYAETGFSYPAYVTIADGNGTYEYALLDEKNCSIIYVFSQFYELDDSDIYSKYSPKGYKVPIEYRDSGTSGYNIYYHYNSIGDGYMYNEVEKV